MLNRNAYIGVLKDKDHVKRFVIIFAHDIHTASAIADRFKKVPKENDCHFIIRDLNMSETMFKNSGNVTIKDIGVYEPFNR